MSTTGILEFNPLILPRLKTSKARLVKHLAPLLSAIVFGLSFTSSHLVADESTFYEPIEREIEGWTVAVDPQLLADENAEVRERAFAALANHLQRISYVMPEKQLERLRQCRIWIELDNEKLGNMQYHPGRGWLIENGHDPKLVKHVHIPRAKNLYSRGTWTKHPYVVLHELAHAYHDQVFGFDFDKIKTLYDAAKESKSYDSIVDHRGRKVKHYAMSTPMEYFAESTEAYFGVNDFYPFVRAELKDHDPKMYELLSEIWGPIR